MNLIRRSIMSIRTWIDAKDHRPIVVALAILELPLVAALWGLTIGLHAPWFTMPIVLAGAAFVVGWTVLVVSALTRWF